MSDEAETAADPEAANEAEPGTLARILPPRQLFRFVVFSGLAALTNLLVGFLLYDVAGWDGIWSYKSAVIIGFSAGMGVSFFLNRTFTFSRSGRRMHQEMRTFALVGQGGLVLTVTFAAGFRATLAPWLATLPPPGSRLWLIANDIEATSHLMAVDLVAFYSFLSHKFLTFNRGIWHQLRKLLR